MLTFYRKMRYTMYTVKARGLSLLERKGFILMSVLNNLPGKAKEVASAVTDRAKDAAELLKINVSIAGEQKDIEKNCLAIGLWFVSDYEGEIPDGIQELVDAVNASKARIAELEASKPAKAEPPAATAAEAEEEKPAGKPCPICGEVSDSKFCPHCGAPMGE